MYKAETFFIEKLRKFPFGTYLVLNKKYKIWQRKKNDRKALKKKSMFVSTLVLTCKRKSFRWEIFGVFNYYAR